VQRILPVNLQWTRFLFFTEEKPLKYLNELQPDVLVKGGDYSRDEVVGYEIVDEYGGEVYVAPLKKGYSTTNIIAQGNQEK